MTCMRAGGIPRGAAPSLKPPATHQRPGQALPVAPGLPAHLPRDLHRSRLPHATATMRHHGVHHGAASCVSAGGSCARSATSTVGLPRCGGAAAAWRAWDASCSSFTSCDAMDVARQSRSRPSSSVSTALTCCCHPPLRLLMGTRESGGPAPPLAWATGGAIGARLVWNARLQPRAGAASGGCLPAHGVMPKRRVDSDTSAPAMATTLIRECTKGRARLVTARSSSNPTRVVDHGATPSFWFFGTRNSKGRYSGCGAARASIPHAVSPTPSPQPQAPHWPKLMRFSFAAKLPKSLRLCTVNFEDQPHHGGSCRNSASLRARRQGWMPRQGHHHRQQQQPRSVGVASSNRNDSSQKIRSGSSAWVPRRGLCRR